MRIGQDRGWAKLGWGVYKIGKQSPSKDRLSWIIAPHFAVVHSICLRKLTFTLLRATSAFLHFVQSAYAKSASSSLKFKFQPTSNRYDLGLLGKYTQLTKFYIRPNWTIKYKLSNNNKKALLKRAFNWLGRKDSNLWMAGPKPAALPLGDAPILSFQWLYFIWPKNYCQ